MRQLLHVALAVLVASFGLRASRAQAEREPVVRGSIGEQYLFSAANAERAQRGLPPLQWDTALYQAADAHAREMASRASISHQYPGEADLASRARAAGARFSVIAENVAEAPTVVRIHDAWMASPGHRANLLDPRSNAIGIRVVRRDGQLYAVEDFSRTVERLSIEDQESGVRSALQASARVTLLPTSDDARQTCAMETGYAGPKTPWFVMRYTTADLNQLPDALRTRLAGGRLQHAEVAACEASKGESFSSYRVAVLLYP